MFFMYTLFVGSLHGRKAGRCMSVIEVRLNTVEDEELWLSNLHTFVTGVADLRSFM